MHAVKSMHSMNDRAASFKRARALVMFAVQALQPHTETEILGDR
jgi:hypothetical protein